MGRFYLAATFVVLSTALGVGLFFEKNFAGSVSASSPNRAFVQREVLNVLEHAGWKPSGEQLIIEKLENRLRTARAIFLSNPKGGSSVPGVMFLVGQKYILVGQDVSPKLFGKVPVVFDVERIHLERAHKRGSREPKLTIIEYGDYGCESCVDLENTLSELLDRHPEIQHVYKHYPLREESRYLAELAEAVALQSEKHFWDLHKRLFSNDKSRWGKNEIDHFVQAQVEELGLDPQLIDETLRTGEPGKRVSRDQSEFPVSQTLRAVVNG
jgi:hypothetical protein